MKKVFSMIIAFILLTQAFLVSAQSGRQMEAYWPAFRGEETLKGITDAKTPTTPEEATLLWQKKLGSGWFANMGAPIEAGDYLYVSVAGSVMKLDKTTGEPLAQGKLSAGIGYFSTIAYGDGKIFVPITGGRVQAFDADTLSPLWITQAPADKNGNALSSLQSLSPVTYHNGYIYMGASDGNAKTGIYFCVSAKDEDPSRTDETKYYTWSYVPPYEAGQYKNGFYWSEGTIAGNAILFAGEAGELFSHHLTKDIFIDTLVLEQSGAGTLEAVRSSLHYDNGNQRVYAATKAGSIHSVKVNADGTFDRTTYLKKYIAPDLTSSPVTFNGRMYVAGGGNSSSAPFSVLDADTLETIYTIEGIKSQSSPVLTTAYASGSNKNSVYAYVLKFGSPDVLYCIHDYEGNTTPDYRELMPSPQPQYNYSSVAVGADGTLYYKNDSGYLYAVGNPNNAYTAADVENAIERLPAAETIRLTDEALVKRVEFRYASLSTEEQAAVSNGDKLTEVRIRLSELQDLSAIIPQLVAGIHQLPSLESITLEHKDLVLALWRTYQSLPDKNKADVNNAQILMEAKSKTDALTDRQTALEMIRKIDSLPSAVTMSAKAAIDTVYAQYGALSSFIKDQVTNAGKLLLLKSQLDALEEEIQWINDAIWSLDPENITLKDNELIEEIIARYGALADEDKTYVPYYEEVLHFKRTVDALKAEQAAGTGESGEEKPSSFLSLATNPKTGDLSFGGYLLFTILCGCLLWLIFQKYILSCHKL